MSHFDGLAHRARVHSQNGEDGIIAEIFRRLDITSGTVVEFGAWDGVYLNNTFALVERGGFHAVYIEADPELFVKLKATAALWPGKVTAINALVGNGDRGYLLDAILAAGAGIPTANRDRNGIVLMSIDIDSFDHDVWRDLGAYEPMVVIIESNTEYKPGVVCTHDLPAVQGNSFSALVELGRKKGYTLACSTGNLFFVRNDLVPKLDLDPRVIADPALLYHKP